MNEMVYLYGGRLKIMVPEQGGNEYRYEDFPENTQRVPCPSNRFPTIPAAIEFSCGNCFSKAFIYEQGVGIVVDLINRVVYPDQPETPIVVETYSDGKLVERQFMKFLEISLDSFCTGEFEVVRLDPYGPEHVGRSDYGLLLECGDVCKKVLNIETIFPEPSNCPGYRPPRDFVVSVFPPSNELLLVKAFTAGKLFEKQGVGQLFTLNSRICIQERKAIQIDNVPQH